MQHGSQAYIKEAKYRITEQKRTPFSEPKDDFKKASKVEPIVTELLETETFKIQLLIEKIMFTTSAVLK